MRLTLFLTTLALPGAALAQAGPADAPAPRFLTLTAGVGNSWGGLGIQVEKYFARTRLSAFGAAGYVPDTDDNDYSGAAFSLGLRGFSPGDKHRGFLELSVGQLLVQEDCFDSCESRYGMGLQAGWHFVTRGGFSLILSLGAGALFNTPPGERSVQPMGGIGLGYTWRR